MRRALPALIATLMVVVSIPIPAVHALAPLQAPTPTVPGAPAGLRLENLWERQQVAHDRLGVMFDHVDWRLSRAQQLIDRAKGNGKDVTTIQTALDAVKQAVQQARPIYDSTQGIVASHQGLDANGNVTDSSQAAETVRDMAEKLREIRGLLQVPTKALRDAVRTFREAYQSH
jgi:hypothetical protein